MYFRSSPFTIVNQIRKRHESIQSHHMGSYIPPKAFGTNDLTTSLCTSNKDNMLGRFIGHSWNSSLGSSPLNGKE